MIRYINNNIVNLSFLIVLLIPPTMIGFTIQFILFLCLLIIKRGKKKEIFSLVVFISIIISFLVNINEESSFKNNFRVFNFVLLFLFFPICKYEKIKDTTLYIALLFIVISQLSIAYRIPGAINFFDSIYPAGEIFNSEYAKELTSIRDLGFNRYAGLYRNPNVCAEYLSLLFIVFIIENYNKKMLFITFISTVFFISIMLTGSRTGAVTFLLVILAYLFFNRKYKYLFLIFVFGIFFIVKNFWNSSEIRIFNITQGFQEGGSFSLKLKILIAYLNKPNLDIVHLLFGNFTIDNSFSIYKIGMFDSGTSNYFYSFGLIGLFSIASFYWYLLSFKNINTYLLMLINIFAISSGVLIIYRMSFLFILLLSNYYSLHNQREFNDSIISANFSRKTF